MPLAIRKSAPADIDTILSLRDTARQIMRQCGNVNQWPEGYPAKNKFETDIANGVSYIVENDGVPVATFALIPSPDPTYAKVYDGPGWRNADEAYGVIHRIASNGSCRGILNAALNFARSTFSDIRIDTHEDNVIMRHSLVKHGFAEVGTILLANGEPRVAYQWIKD